MMKNLGIPSKKNRDVKNLASKTSHGRECGEKFAEETNAGTLVSLASRVFQLKTNPFLARYSLPAMLKLKRVQVLWHCSDAWK